MIADILWRSGMLCVAIAFLAPLMDSETTYMTSLWMIPIGAVMLLISWYLERRKEKR